LCARAAVALPVITDVIETGGDNEPTDTITAKWTGTTFPISVAGEPVPGAVVGGTYSVGVFGNWAPTFVDRNHRYTNAADSAPIPAYLDGLEYIMSGNDNRDNAGYLLDVTVATPVYVYMLIDNRLGDPNSPNSTPPVFGPTKMQWILDEQWEPMMTGANRAGDPAMPDEVALDESADGTLNQWYSIYRKFYPAGTFRLKQADNTGQNMYGVCVASAAPPTAPTLTAVAGDGKVTLNWTVSPGAAGYVLSRSLVAGGPYDVVVTDTTTSYVDVSVVNGTTYYYVVSAFNAPGDSGYSNEAMATPQTAPTGVVAIGGVEQVEVQWTAFPGAESYSLRRSSTSGGPYETVASGISGTSQVDIGLLTGRQFYYVVVAQLTGGGDSGQSEEASALTAPGTPNPVTASVYAASVFQVAWSSTDPVVTSFVIEESLDGSFFQEIASVGGNERTYLVTTIFPEETRYYRVRAINDTGSSVASAPASVTSPAMGWNINFANAINGTPPNDPAPTPDGYVQDIGELYGLRSSGFTYGWDRDITVDSRWRKSASDLRYATFNHLQKASPSAIWELEIPNGFYSVHIVAGDNDNTDSVFQFDLEGVVTLAKSPGGGGNFQEFTQTVIISDGALTVNSGPDAANNKIAFIDVYPAVAAPVIIGTQPQAQTVEENRTVTLSIALSAGSSPFTYRWYKDGVEVPGSETYSADSSATLTIPLAQTDQSGEYTVEVVNYVGSVFSDPATLTVIPDTTPPRALRAYSNPTNFNEVIVEFDELMNQSDVEFPFNYALGLDGPTAGVLAADGKTVALTFGSPLVLNQSYELLVSGVSDLAGVPLSPDPTILAFIGGVVEPPSLAIELSSGNVVVSWPAPSTGFVLQQADSIVDPVSSILWTPVGVVPTVSNGRNSVILPVSGNKVFRLRQ